MKIVVYTCITGGYDAVREDQVFEDGVKYVYFSEENNLEQDSKWEWRKANRLFKDPRRDARRYKMLSHELLPEHDYSIWIDGSVALDIKPTELVKNIGDADLMTFKHPDRTTVAAEAEECIRLQLDDLDTITKHVLDMQTMGFEDKSGLFETKVVVRNDSPDIWLLNEEWFYQMVNGSVRDQISLPYVTSCSEAEIKTMKAINHTTPERRNEWFKFQAHPERTVYR